MGSTLLTLTADTADCQYKILARQDGRSLFVIRLELGQKKVLGPACTDNFQIIPFTFLGTSWYSVEQCYQAQKFPEGSESREKVEKCAPLPDENGSMYGHRVWRLGQRLNGMVLGWDDMKVEMMFLVNAAK